MSQGQSSIQDYLSEIGRRGGRKSRRRLSSEDARNMVRIREARQAFREFYPQCFWYLRPDLKVTLADIPELARGLRQHGGRRGFLLAARLCR
jgi:hypothetical protein